MVSFRAAGNSFPATVAMTCAFMLSFGMDCSAHVISTSYSVLQLNGTEARAELILNLNQMKDAARWDQDKDGRIDRQEAANALDEVQTQVLAEYFLRVNGIIRPAFTRASARTVDDGTAFFVFTTTLPEATDFIEVHASLERVTDPHHQHLMKVVAHDETVQLSFDHGSTEARLEPSRLGVGFVSRFLQFLRLGVIHIVTGYDHLLFLAGLLVTTVAVGQLLRVVTAFTIAHSITLAFSTLGIIILPDRFVECAIPLTIAYVAAQNLWLGSFDKRWRLTFFFGLVHGFGFANALRQLALPRSALATCLFSFNLGVELGQVMFVVVLLPVLWMVAHTRHYQQAMVVSSIVILALGVYWFTVRLFA